MEELPKIHPIKVSKEKEENIIEYSQGWLKAYRKKWLQPFEGEYEKTSEEIQAIQLINVLIQKEISSLGVEVKYSAISPEQIHFIDRKIAI